MFPSTLVKYGSPQVASDHSSKAAIDAIVEKSTKMVPFDTTESTSLRNEEMLDILLPPMVAEKGNEYWYQKISRAPATSGDIFRLQENLDAELLKQEAREIGLCPVRGELYQQCFRELIRQEFMVCPERGRLLRMVYLEKTLSLSAGMSCYESALAYGINKKLSSKHEVLKLNEELTGLLSAADELEVARREAENELLEVRKKCGEEEEEVRKKCDGEEAKLQRENEALLSQMLECVEVEIEVEETTQPSAETKKS